MAVIIVCTGAAVLYRIVGLHRVKHQTKHHYLIFYFALIMCLLWYVHTYRHGIAGWWDNGMAGWWDNSLAD